jgi:hypothetical protein
MSPFLHDIMSVLPTAVVTMKNNDASRIPFILEAPWSNCNTIKRLAACGVRGDGPSHGQPSSHPAAYHIVK